MVMVAVTWHGMSAGQGWANRFLEVEWPKQCSLNEFFKELVGFAIGKSTYS